MQPINQILLNSARSKVSHTPNLEKLAEDHRNYILYNVFSLYEPAKLTAGEVLALFQSAQSDAEDAKYFASFLHQVDDEFIKVLLVQSYNTIPINEFNNLKAIFASKDIYYRTVLETVLRSEQENSHQEQKHIIYLLGLVEVKQYRPQGWGKGNETGFLRLNQLKDNDVYGMALQKEFPEKFTLVKQPIKEVTNTHWQSSTKPTITTIEVSARKKSAGEIPDIEKAIVDKISNIMQKESKLGINPKLFNKIYDKLHKYNLGDKTVYQAILSDLKNILDDKDQKTSNKVYKAIGSINKNFEKNEHTHVVSYIIYEALKQQDHQKSLSYLTKFENNRKIHSDLAGKIPVAKVKKHNDQLSKTMDAHTHKK